ncbi:fibrous sheath-interacting protein 1 isoform X3 [Alosa sapidissima]|uniref:fibrous sheath-interacting protein 1 isoform X3 n=1 Tax=Alosa sapidissima TaxID=34773 RepID=UPI001C08D136|nr:fibrous sheath-interacting protein 1 isoform X3 [Alosa sapidissima]
MDITRGSLEDISRPASSDRTRIGSRVSTASLGEGGRIIRASPTSLEVLSSYTIEEQVHTMVFEAKSFAENISDEDAPGDLLPSETSQTDGSDEENDDPELQKAIKKMKRLDKILAQKVSKEKEVKKKGRELSQKLWRELQELPTKGGRKDVIENTKLFLALTSSTSNESNVELDVVPVFRTQIPEKEYPSQKCVEGECKNSDSATEPSEVDQEQDKEGKADSSRQTGDATGKQAQNFVTKNIELASSGHHVPMTLDEKQRLCELLQDIDNESEDHCSTVADHEGTASMCTTSIRLGEGYTPEPSELDQLVQIDSRLHTLLPREDFLSVRSPYPDHNLPQFHRPLCHPHYSSVCAITTPAFVPSLLQRLCHPHYSSLCAIHTTPAFVPSTLLQRLCHPHYSSVCAIHTTPAFQSSGTPEMEPFENNAVCPVFI